MDDVKWLDDAEMRTWLATLAVMSMLPVRLDHALKAEAGIGLDDYEVLVFLSAAPEHRLRMSELAENVMQSRSRLTYRIDRLVDAGLVERASCPDDRRGTYAVMTEAGRRLLVASAPGHLESVREHLIDVLEPEEIEVVGRALTRVAEKLRASG